ncbi:hypothetical protein FBEOM_8027 [Fusarium beomiforme]|uniref:Uncharacterized protein n=1 Tax=Fusarium beomiforme TaxID=44412 RepID=A0A9P5DXN3_9HYPO|nr:hypothetical protein FBEOM_8027 [Fusarium beomiforme]
MMPSITNTITAWAYLASVSIAMPANLARKPISECATDTWYYSCDTNVNYFDKDTCGEPTPASGKTRDYKEDKPLLLQFAVLYPWQA